MWPSVAGYGGYNFLLSILTRGLKSKWIPETSLWQIGINIERCTGCVVGLCKLEIILKQGKIAF